jgi:hypothetical protein
MSLWQTNLTFLSGRADGWSQTLAARLVEAGPGPDLGLRGRTGGTLPGVVVGSKARALVSSFDADREAERWADGEAVAVLGGGGVQAALALLNRGAGLVLWVEPRLDVWRSLMTWQDWTLVGTRPWFPLMTEAELEDAVVRRYHPLWEGGFRTLEWRSATAGCETQWDGHRRAAARALDEVAGDASTQARFAERWYRNTLVNLRELKAADCGGWTASSAVVAGAGPGLDDALADDDNRRWLDGRPGHGGRLVATDTALPALSARGIVPDLVVNLDGQLATYHHFIPARPTVPLVADLASLPLLGRLGLPVVRYLTRHPFSAVVRRHFPELPILDAPGGHVSALAWSTASALGAHRIDAWGVDFGYRDGQAYARATYVYERRTARLSPLETQVGSLCYGAEGLERRAAGGHLWDTTPRLRDYRRRWPPQAASPATLSHGGAENRWRAFADDWRHRLETLPLPRDRSDMRTFTDGLADDVQQDWLALWPLALALFRRGLTRPADVVERALALFQD